MSQILFRGHGKYITVDKSWRDNGRDPEYALVGGQKVRVSDKIRPYPEIFQAGGVYVYANGQPLDNPEDIGPHVPSKDAELMRKFIAKNKQEPQSLPVYDVSEPVPEPKKGRGRPKKDQAPGKIEITDENSFAEINGGIGVVV